MPTTPSAPATLGIDVGTTNIKVVLASWPVLDPTAAPGAPSPDAADDGADDAPGTPCRVLAEATAPTPGTLEALESAVAGAIRQCLRAAPAVRPEGVAVASMAETGVALDPAGRALGPFVGWADPRATAVAHDLAAEVDAVDLFRRTGVRLGPKPPLAKWGWFARTAPALWRDARWLGAADAVVRALTGQHATDHTLAGRTGALALDAPGFDPDLTALGGITPERLPRVLPPGEPAGAVRHDALGLGDLLPAGIPVFVAGHDHAVGAHAAGVREPGQVADSLGTSEAVYAVVGRTTAAERGRWREEGMSVVRTVAGDQHAVVAGSPAAGGLVAWWCQEHAPTTSPVDLFTTLDAQAPPGALVLPYLHGRQAPAPDPQARVARHGLGPGADPATVAEALLRGLVLHARWMTEVAVGGRPHESVVLGGPTRNAAWMRRKAELTPWTTRLADRSDAVALGAALVAAENLGLRTAPLATAPVRTALDPRHQELYDAFVALATR